MKRTVAIFLGMALVISLLGCGVQQAPGATTEPVLTETDPADTEAVTATEPTPEASTLPPTGPETVVIPQPEPEDTGFVPVSDYIPDIAVELRYSTEDNFTGERIYPFTDAYLRYGTVKKLLLAQDILRSKGLGLKLWDAFRPVSAQFTLWEVCPDPRYVADPRTGFSSHSRGNTVDITLVDAMGQELPMPTGFDDFSALADRNYSDCPEEAAQNALLLQSVMEEAGFTGYYGEWWHFSDTDAYAVEQTFEPLEPHLRLAVCEEYITLRAQADTASEALARIPKNGIFTVLARQDAFLLVSCDGLRGYVLESYTQTIQ